LTAEADSAHPNQPDPDDQIDRMVKALTDPPRGGVDAHVIMPPSDELDVRLVRLDRVYALDQARGALSRYTALGAFFLSVPIGIGVNVLTDAHPHISLAAAIVLAVFTTAALITGLLGAFAYRDVKAQRRRLLPGFDV
jgi:hypothetical protein